MSWSVRCIGLFVDFNVMAPLYRLFVIEFLCDPLRKLFSSSQWSMLYCCTWGTLLVKSLPVSQHKLSQSVQDFLATGRLGEPILHLVLFGLVKVIVCMGSPIMSSFSKSIGEKNEHCGPGGGRMSHKGSGMCTTVGG